MRTKSRSSLNFSNSREEAPFSVESIEPADAFPFFADGRGLAGGGSSSSSSSMTTSSVPFLCPFIEGAAFPFPFALDAGFPLVASDGGTFAVASFLVAGWTTSETSSSSTLSSSSTTTGDSLVDFCFLLFVILETFALEGPAMGREAGVFLFFAPWYGVDGS